MMETEKLIQEINGFLTAHGDDKLAIPGESEGLPEPELLKRAKEEYTKRLLNKLPGYRMLPPAVIPDMFLHALRKREEELKAKAEG